ncbi:MAG: PDGLE domain-containing protein [Parcubacteria group bacterium]
MVKKTKTTKTWVGLLFVSLLIGGGLSLAASPSPDGLEHVADTHGFFGSAASYLAGIMSDYTFPGVDNTHLATALAGVVGTAVVFGTLYILGVLLFPRRQAGQK